MTVCLLSLQLAIQYQPKAGPCAGISVTSSPLCRSPGPRRTQLSCASAGCWCCLHPDLLHLSPGVSHKGSWELMNLSLLSLLWTVSAAWFLHEINNIFPSMNISPLLFAVFSCGVVLCQPSLCSSQSWEIKCLQQYCASVMLNQQAGLASVNPSVSRQRFFSEQRSQR